MTSLDLSNSEGFAVGKLSLLKGRKAKAPPRAQALAPARPGAALGPLSFNRAQLTPPSSVGGRPAYDMGPVLSPPSEDKPTSPDSKIPRSPPAALAASPGRHPGTFLLPAFDGEARIGLGAFAVASLTYSVPLFLKRQCDRTLGAYGAAGHAAAPRAAPAAPARGRALSHCRRGHRAALQQVTLRRACGRGVAGVGRACRAADSCVTGSSEGGLPRRRRGRRSAA